MSLPQVYKTTNKNAFFVIFCCNVYCYICLAAGIKPSAHQHSFTISVSFSCLSTIGYICAVKQNNNNNNNNSNNNSLVVCSLTKIWTPLRIRDLLQIWCDQQS